MHTGRYHLGEEITLPVLCLTGSGVPTDPDEAPTLEVYSSSGKPLSGQKISTLEPLATTGLFVGRVFLDESFTTGRYHALVRWLISSTQGSQLFEFEILPGGSATGDVIALHPYERPHATFLVQQRSSGRIFRGKNPRV